MHPPFYKKSPKKFGLFYFGTYAYSASDLDLFSSYYHPEILVVNLPSKEVVVSGIKDFRSFYQFIFERYPNQRCLLQSRVLNKETVTDVELIMGREDFPEGITVRATYSFRDGLIDKVYFEK